MPTRSVDIILYTLRFYQNQESTYYAISGDQLPADDFFLHHLSADGFFFFIIFFLFSSSFLISRTLLLNKPRKLLRRKNTYSAPLSKALRLTTSLLSRAFSFFVRAVSSPCSFNFVTNSSLSSLPLPLTALIILPNSPLNFS